MPEKSPVHNPSGGDYWQSTLSGHGIAYFRELVVDYETLEWVNPHATTATEAQSQADEKSKDVDRAEEALKLSSTPEDPALKKVIEDARVAASSARQVAMNAAAIKISADKSREAADRIIFGLIDRFATDRATWSDILEFESALIRLLPNEKLKSKYASLAAEYRGVTGTAAPSMPQDELVLRATAETLLADLHWAYTTGPFQEEIKSKMVVSLIGITVMVMLAAAGIATWSKCWILPWVAIAGAVGAALSAFQRVQSRNVKGDALTNCGKIHDGEPWFNKSFPAIVHKLWRWMSGHGSFALAPVIGAVSAIVMAHILAAGLVSGAVFPKMAQKSNHTRMSTNAPVPRVQTATTTTGVPETNAAAAAVVSGGGGTNDSSTNATNLQKQLADTEVGGECESSVCCWCYANCAQVALLLVWAFAAGFSERLVPDIISRLDERTRAQGSST